MTGEMRWKDSYLVGPHIYSVLQRAPQLQLTLVSKQDVYLLTLGMYHKKVLQGSIHNRLSCSCLRKSRLWSLNNQPAKPITKVHHSNHEYGTAMVVVTS